MPYRVLCIRFQSRRDACIYIPMGLVMLIYFVVCFIVFPIYATNSSSYYAGPCRFDSGDRWWEATHRPCCAGARQTNLTVGKLTCG